ncbi:RNA-directed DNA polymerase, eukaryota [Tanacetum coccineum]
MYANIARFNREFKSPTMPSVAHKPTPAPFNPKVPLKVPKPSFANVVQNKGNQANLDDNVMNLEPNQVCYENNQVLVGCVKDFKTISKLHIACSTEGFSGIKFSYLGGFWILLEFESIQSCTKFLSHMGINSWFSILRQWTPQFEVPDRVVWIDVEGLPLCAWSHTNLIKIASKWGELVYLDSNDSNKYSTRLCVRTNAKHLILESFKVSIKGKVITIRAKEVTGWVPDFGKTDSDINSVSIHNWEDTDDDDVVIPDSFQGYDFGNTHKDKSDHERSYAESVPKEVNDHASDPFGLDGLILKSAKKHAKIPHLKSDSDPTFPPGFTPDISLQPDNAAEKVTKESTPLSSPIHAKNDSPIVHEVEESNNNMGKVTGSEHIEISKEDHHDSMSRSSKPINGFSILDRFQEFIDIGQTMGYGLGGKEKKKWVKNLCHSNQVNLLSLQETKMVSLDIFVVRALWGNMLFDFATSSARGRSGGILCVWDKTLFQKKRTYATDSCLCVEGTWLATKSDLLFISVYSPQELNLKRVLWSYISGIISRWHGDVVVMGDFNEVRFASERYGSSFHALNAANFNSFIANSNLIDIPLGGYSYTWADKYASKMSKLDRFLVSQGIVDLFPNLTGLVLHRNISDHRPILLKESHVDYGPTPFRKEARSLTAKVFKKPLFRLIKGLTIGDENSKYFHGIVNKKRRDLAIKGILVDGDWIDDPARVKSEFFKHFANQFSDPGWSRAPFDGKFSNLLDPIQSNDLESDISNEEIKKAVWDCGSDKSPRPDGFTLIFLRSSGILSVEKLSMPLRNSLILANSLMVATLRLLLSSQKCWTPRISTTSD